MSVKKHKLGECSEFLKLEYSVVTHKKGVNTPDVQKYDLSEIEVSESVFQILKSMHNILIQNRTTTGSGSILLLNRGLINFYRCCKFALLPDGKKLLRVNIEREDNINKLVFGVILKGKTVFDYKLFLNMINIMESNNTPISKFYFNSDNFLTNNVASISLSTIVNQSFLSIDTPFYIQSTRFLIDLLKERRNFLLSKNKKGSSRGRFTFSLAYHRMFNPEMLDDNGRINYRSEHELSSLFTSDKVIIDSLYREIGTDMFRGYSGLHSLIADKAMKKTTPKNRLFSTGNTHIPVRVATYYLDEDGEIVVPPDVWDIINLYTNREYKVNSFKTASSYHMIDNMQGAKIMCRSSLDICKDMGLTKFYKFKLEHLLLMLGYYTNLGGSFTKDESRYFECTSAIYKSLTPMIHGQYALGLIRNGDINLGKLKETELVGIEGDVLKFYFEKYYSSYGLPNKNKEGINTIIEQFNNLKLKEIRSL